jgi:hypothetical protein
MITEEKLKAVVDFDDVEVRIMQHLNSIKTHEALMQFMIEYASWNGAFANGVTKLAGLIGSLRKHFMEPGYPVQLADRSNLVASYVFDAARDEYDDSINTGRDPHRSLAQATLSTMATYLHMEHLLNEPDSYWLTGLNTQVLMGYGGHSDTIEAAFLGLGYHLGSELLADCEFSLIDRHMRSKFDALTQHMMRQTVEIGGVKHRGYAWIGIHSGHGGGVEAEHFAAAVEGVNAALSYIEPELRPRMEALVYEGFKEFDYDHRTFFQRDRSEATGASGSGA